MIVLNPDGKTKGPRQSEKWLGSHLKTKHIANIIKGD